MPVTERLMHVKNGGDIAIGNKRGQIFLCHAGASWHLAPGDVASWPESVVEHAYKLEYCQLHLERLPEEEGAVVYHETMLRLAKDKQLEAQNALIKQNDATQKANKTLSDALALREKAVRDAELIGSAHPSGEEDPFDQEKGLDLTPPRRVPPPPPPEQRDPFPIGGGVPPVPPLQPRAKPPVMEPAPEETAENKSKKK